MCLTHISKNHLKDLRGRDRSYFVFSSVCSVGPSSKPPPLSPGYPRSWVGGCRPDPSLVENLVELPGGCLLGAIFLACFYINLISNTGSIFLTRVFFARPSQGHNYGARLLFGTPQRLDLFGHLFYISDLKCWVVSATPSTNVFSQRCIPFNLGWIPTANSHLYMTLLL